MQIDPLSIEGDFEAQQAGKASLTGTTRLCGPRCTVCAQCFDCATYRTVLTKSGQRRGTIPGDHDRLNIHKN